MRKLQNILLTGGAGFIGSNFIHYSFFSKKFSGRIINMDKLTYAGDLEKLEGLEELTNKKYFFEKVDICDKAIVKEVFEKYDIDTVIHMAAESHVDRSIDSPMEFLQTNIIGTYNLLECAKDYWKDRKDVLFHHVSTDEVYGSLGDEGLFHETTAYDPRSPYSASKASSDHLVRAFFHTYNLPVTISNCSNNYGPRQNKEKLIPLMLSNILKGEKLPVYGDGKNIRDWIFVDDHNEGIWDIIEKAELGETYNLGGNNEIRNIELVNTLCEKVAEKKEVNPETFKSLITYVTDRKGHDYRYAIDNSKAKDELNWVPRTSFEKGIEKTINWYMDE